MRQGVLPGVLPAVWLVLGLLSLPALAHGLLVSVKVEGRAIVGTVYYSDGLLAVGEFVQLFDDDAPQTAPQEATTDAKGNFRFENGTLGHRYRVLAHGEEGHHTEMQLILQEGAKAQLNDADAVADEAAGPPAWLVLGGLLALSALPAWWLRKRS